MWLLGQSLPLPPQLGLSASAIDILITLGLAAAPWGEIVLAVPVGTALGLPVLLAFGIAVVGNILPVLVLLAIADKISTRKPSSTGSAKRKRAEAFFEKWGVAGLALIAPILTGVYIATAVCAYFSVPKGKVIAWMGASILLWGAIAAGVTAGFLSAFNI